MSLRDLDEFLLDKPIELPIRGKLYRFPGSISATSGLLLQRLAATVEQAVADGAANVNGTALAMEVLNDGQEKNLREEVMGDTEAQMAADGLSTAHTDHVFKTLLTWHMAGPEAGEAAWEHQGEAPAPNRETRRKASKGSASTTKRPASTSGTSTPAPKATTSAGPDSSSSGL
jgi:hypothetical protein